MDYRALFRKCIHNACMFKFQKLFKIEQEYSVVFREYHSKYRDELFFEHKYRPYLPRLKNMIFNFDKLSKLKKPFFNYFVILRFSPCHQGIRNNQNICLNFLQKKLHFFIDFNGQRPYLSTCHVTVTL